MVLEACVVCVDNSEYMRNGDYVPSRMEAQADAVNLLCGTKTQSNPESTVGVLTMAGKGAEMLISPTQDLGKVLTSLHGVKIEGRCDVRSSLQVGALALKLRQNKNQRQRLVVFVGSPVTGDSAALVSLGKKLKKNNVAVDIVDFSNHDANEAKLQGIIDAVNSNDNSHYVKIPPGTGVLSDALVSTPIIMGEDGDDGGMAAAMAASGGGGGFPGGVDPNVDPELALALQLSMQEAEAAAAAQQGGSADTAMADAPPAAPAPPGGAAASGAPPVPAPPAGGDMDETALIEQALAMSLQDGGAAPAGGAAGGDTTMTEASEEDQIAAALAMSLQGAPDAPPPPSSAIQDPAFVNNVIGSLPGVDPNDPKIKAALEKAKKDGDDKKDKK